MKPMGTSDGLDSHSWRSRTSHILAALALCFSLLILLGWWFKIDFLQRIVPLSAPIHPHTALAFVAASVAVLMSPWERNWQQRLAMIFAVISVVIGTLRVIATASRHSLWIGDPLPLHGAAVMAMSTAIVLACLGVGCLCMMAPRGRNWVLAISLALIAAAFGATAAFGHLFQSIAFYAVAGQVMALPTAILTLLVASSLAMSRPPAGTFSTVIHRVSSGWLNLSIRHKCAAVVALPVACLLFEIGWQIRVLQSLDDAQRWTIHTQQVELTVAEMQRLLLQVETNDRGFGLSGSGVFFAPLSQQEAEVLEVGQKLSSLVQDNPQQSARARNLQELSRIKLDFASDVTAFFASHPTSARFPQVSLR